MNLSKNFTLQELCKSQTAIRKGLRNVPNEDQVENLRILCERVLQPVRDHFGKVVTITSGYRDIVLNRMIGGSDNSQHILGMAADIEIFGIPTHEVSDWIRQNLMFDQLILEFYTPGEKNSGWTHVSYNPSINQNRKQYLAALRIDGKTQYKPISGLSTDRYVK